MELNFYSPLNDTVSFGYSIVKLFYRENVAYHFYNLKNVKNTHGGMSRFLNCVNGTKLRNASYIQTAKAFSQRAS